MLRFHIHVTGHTLQTSACFPYYFFTIAVGKLLSLDIDLSFPPFYKILFSHSTGIDLVHQILPSLSSAQLSFAKPAAVPSTPALQRGRQCASSTSVCAGLLQPRTSVIPCFF